MKNSQKNTKKIRERNPRYPSTPSCVLERRLSATLIHLGGIHIERKRKRSRFQIAFFRKFNFLFTTSSSKDQRKILLSFEVTWTLRDHSHWAEANAEDFLLDLCQYSTWIGHYILPETQLKIGVVFAFAFDQCESGFMRKALYPTRSFHL